VRECVCQCVLSVCACVCVCECVMSVYECMCECVCVGVSVCVDRVCDCASV
jgi:hypothetical protein